MQKASERCFRSSADLTDLTRTGFTWVRHDLYFSYSATQLLIYPSASRLLRVLMAFSRGRFTELRRRFRAISKATRAIKTKGCRAVAVPPAPGERRSLPSTNWSQLPFEIKSQILRELFDNLLTHLQRDAIAMNNMQNDPPFSWNYTFERLNDIHYLLIAVPELLEEARSIALAIRNDQSIGCIVRIALKLHQSVIFKSTRRLSRDDLKYIWLTELLRDIDAVLMIKRRFPYMTLSSQVRVAWHPIDCPSQTLNWCRICYAYPRRVTSHSSSSSLLRRLRCD